MVAKFSPLLNPSQAPNLEATLFLHISRFGNKQLTHKHGGYRNACLS